MKLYIDGQKIFIFPQLMKKIGEGLEGKVYLYKNEALKLYRYPGMQTGSLTLKDALYLKELSTANILLPNSVITNEANKIVGYTTTYIEKCNESIHNLKKEKLLLKIKQLKDELDYLSEHNVLVNDWINVNFLYNGSIIFFDPGMYEIVSLEDYSKKQVYIHNYHQLRYFILHELIVSKKYPKSSQYQLRYLFYHELLEEYKNKPYKDIIEFLNDKLSSNDTLDDYILKKTHK